MDADRSFERIYRRHRREVYGSVLRDVRDPDEAEDVTQAAFLNAFRAMRRGDRPEKPRAWLLTIARNVVRKRARLREDRPQEVALDPDSELLAAPDDTEGSASADIHAALRRLTDAQREVVLLREIQGRSYAEIAFELGLSVSAVEALIFRARRALAEELELVERVPVVRPERRHGLLALPGFAKLGSFGFSMGRVAAACVAGCAVVATIPVGDGGASGDPAAAKAPVERALIAEAVSLPHPAPPAQPARESDRATPASRDRRSEEKPPKAESRESSGSEGGSLLPAELPPVDLPAVELPPVELPPVQLPLPVPEVSPPPALPDVDVPQLPEPSSLTS